MTFYYETTLNEKFFSRSHVRTERPFSCRQTRVSPAYALATLATGVSGLVRRPLLQVQHTPDTKTRTGVQIPASAAAAVINKQHGRRVGHEDRRLSFVPSVWNFSKDGKYI